MYFADRRAAGRVLARALARYANPGETVVLALPRGGVPVAYEVAVALRSPLDVFTVRKLGVPGHEELAMGAVASGDSVLLDEGLIASLELSAADVEAVKRRELRELERRELLYRDERPRPDIAGKTTIVVDDGLATGSSMRAAVEALRRRRPARIIAAVPVGAAETCKRLRAIADDVVCVLEPEHFYAVGAYYEDFRQTSDDEVRTLLAASEERLHR